MKIDINPQNRSILIDYEGYINHIKGMKMKILNILKTLIVGTLLGLLYIIVLTLHGLGIPLEIVPMVGGSLYVGAKSITRIKG